MLIATGRISLVSPLMGLEVSLHILAANLVRKKPGKIGLFEIILSYHLKVASSRLHPL